MKANDPRLRQYYRAIRKWLPCGRKQKKQIMEQIQNDVQFFFEQNPTADFAQLQAELGDPLTIAAAYVETADTLELLRSLRIRRRIVAIILITAAVVLLMWAGTVLWAILKEIDFTHGYIDVETF